MILHPEDLRLLLSLLGAEGARLHELARFHDSMGRLDRRDKTLQRIAQIDRLRPIFTRPGRCLVSDYRFHPGRPRKGCGKLEEGLIIS